MSINKKLKKELNTYLANSAVMYVKLHNLHWNVKGQNFKEIHEYLELQYDAYGVMLDEIAEVLCMFEICPPATMLDYIEIASINELKSKAISIPKALEIFKEDTIANRQLARKIRDRANDLDNFQVVGMLETHIGEFDKAIWFTDSMLKKC